MILCFFLSTRLLGNGWTDFHHIFFSPKHVFAVLFVNGWYPMKISPHNFGGLKRTFLSDNDWALLFKILRARAPVACRIDLCIAEGVVMVFKGLTEWCDGGRSSVRDRGM